jgi:hypothetical protein
MVGLSHGARGDVALRKSGVKFRTRANDDGTFERWQSPNLPAWEVPKSLSGNIILDCIAFEA